MGLAIPPKPYLGGVFNLGRTHHHIALVFGGLMGVGCSNPLDQPFCVRMVGGGGSIPPGSRLVGLGDMQLSVWHLPMAQKGAFDPANPWA